MSPIQVADEDIWASLVHSLSISKRLKCCYTGEGRNKKIGENLFSCVEKFNSHSGFCMFVQLAGSGVATLAVQ